MNRDHVYAFMNFVGVFCGIVAAFLSVLGSSTESGLSKNYLTSEITSVVRNGGDLRSVKRVFSQAHKVKFGFFLVKKEDLYPLDVTLGDVLDDIRVFSIVEKDHELFNNVDSLLAENEKVNPFDRLKHGQKDYFENIRIKSGEKYELIQNDVFKLSDELHNQNTLVAEYLADSTKSFRISVFAVFLSAAIGAYQIWQGRSGRVRKLIQDASKQE